MTQLSKHFSLEELEHSQTAISRDIDNTAPLDVMDHLTVLAEGLEAVRALLGYPLNINSGYRCPELNKAVGGSEHSAHMEGYAADFTCHQFGTIMDIVRRVTASDIKFDKVISEGTWCHISFDPQLRRRTMTAHFDAGGKATYTAGA